MKFGRVLTYKDIKEAKELIGKKVVGRDVISTIEKSPECCIVGTLCEFNREMYFPFKVDGDRWQFIREVIEEPELMTNRQLSEWCAKGNGERTYIDVDNVSSSHGYPKSEQNAPVLNDARIRYWDSEEWILPTVDIYERDCKGGSK